MLTRASNVLLPPDATKNSSSRRPGRSVTLHRQRRRRRGKADRDGASAGVRRHFPPEGSTVVPMLFISPSQKMISMVVVCALFVAEKGHFERLQIQQIRHVADALANSPSTQMGFLMDDQLACKIFQLHLPDLGLYGLMESILFVPDWVKRHKLTHLLGGFAYENVETVRLLEIASTNLSIALGFEGLMHSASWQALYGKGLSLYSNSSGSLLSTHLNVTRLWSVMREFCSKGWFSSSTMHYKMCIHGAGHGIVMLKMRHEMSLTEPSPCIHYRYGASVLTENLLTEALIVCEASPYPSMCVAGVYEEFWTVEPRHDIAAATLESRTVFCSKVSMSEQLCIRYALTDLNLKGISNSMSGDPYTSERYNEVAALQYPELARLA